MSDILSILNPQQQEAVECTEGPLLILAGAGSGKTRVLTHRIAYLIREKGVKPWNILAITFTNKAAKEMRERVDALLEEEGAGVWVSTFHSTCVRMLRRFADRIGFDSHFSIFDKDDQKTLIGQVIKQLELDSTVYKEGPILASISSAKNDMLTPERLEKKLGGDRYARTVGDVFREYQKQLVRNNAMDFDDLLLQTVYLLQKDSEVLRYYQDRFHYLLIDEYQDTNQVQFEMVRLLASAKGNICVVGDDDQSIYRFRGADITNILSFEQHFPGAKVIRLEQNYRSTNSILEAANQVISHNRSRREKKLWSENGVGKKVAFRRYDTGRDEAEDIISQIKDNCRRGTRSYRDYAVLYRTNAQSRAFEEVCVRAGLPYRLIGGVNFYQRKEVKDILAYLKTIDSGRDEIALQRIINTPRRGIGAVTLNKVAVFAQANDLSLLQAMEHVENIPGIGKAGEKIKAFTNLIMRLRVEAQEFPLDELILHVIDETGYRELLDGMEEEEAQERSENLDEMVNKAADYLETAADTSLSAFLEEVTLVSDADLTDDAQDALTLMTLHGAKGLEFPVVFMAGMEEGLFPGYLSINSGDREDIEEERRLCYVGITRAKEELTLSSASRRFLRGSEQHFAISRFVSELKKEDLDWKSYAEEFDGEGFSGSSRFSRGYGSSGWSGRNSGWSGYPEEGSSFSGRREQRAGASVSSQAGYMDSRTQNRYAADFGHTQGSNPGFGKSIPAVKPDTLPYAVGDRVRSSKFGAGDVREIVDAGKDYKVTVDFDDYGERKLMAMFANLEKID